MTRRRIVLSSLVLMGLSSAFGIGAPTPATPNPSEARLQPEPPSRRDRSGPIVPPDRLAGLARPIVGDAGGELRRPDGTIDVEGTLIRIQEMGVNTFFYQVWQGKRDWEQLPEFAAMAEKRGIQVWVYLIPWSEGRPRRKNGSDSEPYRQDFVTWGREIAKLSLKHPNVVGWTIDDFYNNAQPQDYDRFTPEYVRKMRDASREVNPRLQFWPVLYTNQNWPDFQARFGDLVDGAVVCYPRSEPEINDLLGYLRGEPRGAGVLFVAGGDTRANEPGEFFARLGNAAEQAREIRFFFDDQLTSAQPNPHVVELRLNGEVIWEKVIDAEGFDRRIRVPLPRGLKARDELRFRVVCDDEWRRELFIIRISDIAILDENEQRLGDLGWRDFDAPGVDAIYLRPTRQRELNLPLLLMPAGLPYQHEKRYQEEATPENFRRKLDLCSMLIQDGRAVGMVTWYAPKERKFADFRQQMNEVYTDLQRRRGRRR